jgi:hypothetical protein
LITIRSFGIRAIRYSFDARECHKITSRTWPLTPHRKSYGEGRDEAREGELIDEAFKDGRFHTLKVYAIINI